MLTTPLPGFMFFGSKPSDIVKALNISHGFCFVLVLNVISCISLGKIRRNALSI